MVKKIKVLGIDEAGKGAALGPLVLAGVMIEQGKESELGKVKDSKLVRHKKRLVFDKELRKNFEHKIIVVSPEIIDAAVLSGELNLNWLEAHKQAEIINDLKPDKAIIDCPSNNLLAYENYLRNLLDNKNMNLVVEHKADFKYPIVAAASILAKVERENQMDKIRKECGDCGPGYPANQKTRDFIQKYWREHPKIFRKSWSTYQKLTKPNYQETLF